MSPKFAVAVEGMRVEYTASVRMPWEFQSNDNQHDHNDKHASKASCIV